MVLPDATKGITIKQPVLLIIHFFLVATSADAAAVQTVLAGMFPGSSHWCMAQPQSEQCSLLYLGCILAQSDKQVLGLLLYLFITSAQL
jgi:hypothetical protein